MRTSILCLLSLLTIVSALSGTHVNISISQQHSKNGAHLVDSNLMNDHQSKLKSDDVEHSGEYVSDNGRSARLEINEKNDERQVKHTNHKAEGSSHNSRVLLDSGSDRVQLVQPHYNHRSMYSMSPIEYQRNGQFRQMNNQQKQNMEFERYIQHYHSAPTVETVFESADAAPGHSGTSRLHHEPSHGQHSAKLVQFERQVALPAASVASVESQQQSQQQQHQPVQVSEKSSAASVAAPTTVVAASAPAPHPVASVSASSGVSVNPPSGNTYHININQRPASVGSDGLNFDQTPSYSKPTYNEPQPTFKYNNDDSDIHFQNQYPPSVEEPQGGYGGFYQPNYVPSGYDQHYSGHNNYLPPDPQASQRPVVTKTIQIAQPAIKTKKYEVRHPAIQKEFYDIEERVLIKPAGTVVVELERPVAKIPKGESILPLGHPHPAVAGAYMNNGNTPSFSNIIYSASGGSHQSSSGNNQYNPSNDYNNKHVSGSGSTLASTITSNPRYDQGSKELAVEANLNKQYNGESHFTAAPAQVTSEDSKPKNRELIVITDGQGNQRQVSSNQFSYSRDETDKPSPSRSGYNLRSYANHNNVATPQRSNYQPNHSNRNDYNFEAEYINTAGNSGNSQRENKPARLEEAPVKVMERQPIIKHNIHVAPSQHKIYLTRSEDVPQSRYVEEAAHVQEVKPFLRNQRGPMIVYAATKPRPELQFRPAADYRPQSQVVQYRNSDRSFHKSPENNRPEISAPYAQMRYVHSNEHNRRQYPVQERESKKYGQLIQEDLNSNSNKDMKLKADNEMKAHNNSLHEAQTSIEISIPQSSKDSHKPIVVSSTIRPMMSDDGEAMHNSKLEISITNNGEPKENPMIAAEKEQEHLAEIKDGIDCDKKLAPENEQKFMRLVESSSNEAAKAKDSALTAEPAVSNVQPSNVDVHNKGSSGHHHHMLEEGSRVIAATPAPKDPSSASESFHKRRIVVNHPFQTVREVVEHEPYTNYHEVQVNEPASPALYHSAAYFQSHGALRDGREEHHMKSPIYYQ